MLNTFRFFKAKTAAKVETFFRNKVKKLIFFIPQNPRKSPKNLHISRDFIYYKKQLLHRSNHQ